MLARWKEGQGEEESKADTTAYAKRGLEATESPVHLAKFRHSIRLAHS